MLKRFKQKVDFLKHLKHGKNAEINELKRRFITISQLKDNPVKQKNREAPEART